MAAYNLRKWKLGVQGSRALGDVDRTEDAETRRKKRRRNSDRGAKSERDVTACKGRRA